jgi:phage regulator Rha-like protein
MENLVKIENGKSVTTSVLIAIKFEKRHSDVIRAIRRLDCSIEFHQRNFALMLKNRELPNKAITEGDYIQFYTNQRREK